MLILFVIQSFFTIGTECRVFCEDSNVTPWITTGPSCPVNCANILTAVMKLKSKDYTHNLGMDNIEDEKTNTHLKIIDQAIQNISLNVKKYGNSTLNIIEKYYKVFSNDNVLRELESFGEDSRLCLKKYMKIFHCRRSAKNSLKKITSILNKYKDDDYLFTEKMTWIILNSFLGKNLNLKYGITDVKKLVLKLETAMIFYEHLAMKRVSITLKPTHCLSVFVTGCFCKQGYVEDAGQCVLPKDCINDNSYMEYLPRIHVI